MFKHTKITTADICNAIGRREIANAVGVGLTSVSNAAVDGMFPAKWFDAVEALCEKSGVPCPRRLFSFSGNVIAKDSKATAPENAEASDAR